MHKELHSHMWIYLMYKQVHKNIYRTSKLHTILNQVHYGKHLDVHQTSVEFFIYT